jgi:hypothetical protein
MMVSAVCWNWSLFDILVCFCTTHEFPLSITHALLRLRIRALLAQFNRLLFTSAFPIEHCSLHLPVQQLYTSLQIRPAIYTSQRNV